MKRILFIHRSVGNHLIYRGNLRQQLSVRNIELEDYDNNKGMLTRTDGSTERNLIAMPGNNTNPDNLAHFFREWNTLLDNYDAVMVKSCYPNSHIKSDEQLETIKQQYMQIIQAFKAHRKTLIILTSPPLRPNSTNQAEASRAIALADWLMSRAGANIHVFNYHELLSGTDGVHKGMLKKGYRAFFMPWDSHPNAHADRTVAPVLVTFLSGLF